MTNPVKILDYDALASVQVGVIITFVLEDPGAAAQTLEIERSENNAPYVKIWEVQTNANEYIDKGVHSGARYRYRVKVKGDDTMEWREGIRVLIQTELVGFVV